MAGCVTGKTVFDTEELAVEALVQNHIRNRHRPGAGPVNVYACDDCGAFHFTSRPPAHSILSDPETLQENPRRTTRIRLAIIFCVLNNFSTTAAVF